MSINQSPNGRAQWEQNIVIPSGTASPQPCLPSMHAISRAPYPSKVARFTSSTASPSI